MMADPSDRELFLQEELANKVFSTHAEEDHREHSDIDCRGAKVDDGKNPRRYHG